MRLIRKINKISNISLILIRFQNNFERFEKNTGDTLFFIRAEFLQD